MVKIDKIYTRTGDDGSTGLVGGSRTKKNSLRVHAYGEIDELNSFIGLVFTQAREIGATQLIEKLALISNELFDVGAVLATPNGAKTKSLVTIDPSQATRLEEWIDSLTAGLPPLRSFVLPGGTPLNASLHIARAVCRRAERAIVELHTHEAVQPSILIYINRLSDLLFAMARSESHRLGIPELLWQPGKK